MAAFLWLKAVLFFWLRAAFRGLKVALRFVFTVAVRLAARFGLPWIGYER
jgi:hypothetical protein